MWYFQVHHYKLCESLDQIRDSALDRFFPWKLALRSENPEQFSSNSNRSEAVLFVAAEALLHQTKDNFSLFLILIRFFVPFLLFCDCRFSSDFYRQFRSFCRVIFPLHESFRCLVSPGTNVPKFRLSGRIESFPSIWTTRRIQVIKPIHSMTFVTVDGRVLILAPSWQEIDICSWRASEVYRLDTKFCHYWIISMMRSTDPVKSTLKLYGLNHVGVNVIWSDVWHFGEASPWENLIFGICVIYHWFYDFKEARLSSLLCNIHCKMLKIWFGFEICTAFDFYWVDS